MTHARPATPVPPAPIGAPGAQPASPSGDDAGPNHACIRCGAPVAIDVGLCERCNPLGLRDVAASQVHGTVFIGVVAAFVLLALVARLAVTGIGPFPVTVDAVSPSPDGVLISLTVRNDGAAAGQTTCRITRTSNRGGGPSAFVLSPTIEPGRTVRFEHVVTELGPEVGPLVVECRAP